EWRVRDMGIEAIRASFGYANYAHNELVFDDAIGADAIGSRFTNEEREGRAEIDHARLRTPLGILRGTAGIQVSTRDLTGLSLEGDNLIEPSTTRKTAGFLLEELQMSRRLRLLGSLRFQNDAITGSTYEDPLAPGGLLVDYDKSFNTKSGSVGLLYDLPLGVVARLTGLYAERAPEAQELFSKGAHEATGTFELGNPDLTLEKGRTIEAGFKREKGPLRFDAAAYYTQYNGFIFRQLTGESCEADLASCTPGGAGGDLMQIVFGQRDATFYGTELAGEYDVGHVGRGVWGISGRYDFVRARFEDDENVPRIPPHRLGGGLYYRDGQWRASVDLLHAFRQDEIALNETPTNGYTLLNAGISYTMKLGAYGDIAPEMTIGVRGENLLDDDVRNSASFKKDEVLQPGRNVRLYGSVRF
ncbi:MAG: TonB-dependent receptor, partial [Hyphomicrobiaceae bacterium]